MNNNKSIPAGSKLNLLRQICNLIPEFLVAKIARATQVTGKARTFTPWSHVVALLFAQLTHSIGLNDVCDALRLHSGPLSSLRGAKPPSRNNLSHANKVRPAEMAEQLFWAVFKHLGDLSPRFVSGSGRQRFAIVDTARHNDAKRARELCAGIQAGEIVIFDKAYIDFSHLADLSLRLVFWVTRAKDNLQYTASHHYQKGTFGRILRDELIRLKTPASRQDYPELLRRVVALVEVDGKDVAMEFLTKIGRASCRERV